MRTNIYKEKILTLLKGNHLLSIADISRGIPEADYSTVYRNVEQLLKDKQVKQVLVDNKLAMYELVHDSAHDHFICDGCGCVDAITVSRTGIDASITDITVRGICNDCK